MARTVLPLNPDGPPPDHRTTRVVCYFTDADAELLSELAHKLGMQRSKLIGAVFERLLLGGFSMLVFLKIALQLQSRLRDRGEDASRGLYFGVSPLPTLPETEDPDSAQTIEALETIKKELKTC